MLAVYTKGAQQNGDLRLEEGKNTGSTIKGRVEIFLNNTWGTLKSPDTEDQQASAAEVICRQLQHGDVNGYGEVHNFE